MSALRRLAVAASVGCALVIVPVTPAAHASSTYVVTGPYCPEKAPLFGKWTGTEVLDGHIFDVYMVPKNFGYVWERVPCD